MYLMKVCVNSQTPFIRFKLGYEELLEKYGSLSDPLDVRELEEGIDYEFTPGGVTAIVYPSMKRLKTEGFLEDVKWVSLGVNYPPRVIVDDILISHVEIDENVLREYTSFKEELWLEIHGSGTGKFTQSGFSAYATYNWANARKLYEYINDVDLYYVQDFQLLMTGPVVGPSAPAILRWHIPFVPEQMGKFARRLIIKNMESFDALVVSTRRDLEGLIKSQYRGKAYQLYPYIDPDEWTQPSSSVIQSVSDKIGFKKDEKIVLMVARMDEIKSQDIAIEALALARKQEKIKLVLIGNGSFSSSSSGGLGYGKGKIWRSELEKIVKELNLEGSVAFLGHSSREELKAAYSLASLVLLSSRVEGFGVTVLEGWVNKKPVVISSGAGASELVVNDSNGYVFPSGDFQAAAEMILKALGSRGDKLGENGYETSKQCHLDVSVQREKAIMEEVGEGFKLMSN